MPANKSISQKKKGDKKEVGDVAKQRAGKRGQVVRVCVCARARPRAPAYLTETGMRLCCSRAGATSSFVLPWSDVQIGKGDATSLSPGSPCMLATTLLRRGVMVGVDGSALVVVVVPVLLAMRWAKTSMSFGRSQSSVGVAAHRVLLKAT